MHIAKGIRRLLEVIEPPSNAPKESAAAEQNNNSFRIIETEEIWIPEDHQKTLIISRKCLPYDFNLDLLRHDYDAWCDSLPYEPHCKPLSDISDRRERLDTFSIFLLYMKGKFTLFSFLI